MPTEADPTDAPEESQEEPPEQQEEPFDAERAKAKIAKTNAEAKALRARLQAAEAKAARLDALEDEKKTDAEKLTERITAAEARATEAEARALRAEVAADKGLTPAQAKRLVGTTKEELEADADELLSSFKPADDTEPGVRRPKETLRPGAVPDADKPDPSDPALLVKDVPRF